MHLRPTRPSPARGFTLVEVLVALSIMSMLMVALYTTLNSTLKARDQLETEAKAASLGPGILDIIEADLRRAWILGIDGDHVFLGDSHTIDGEPADALSFLTSVDSTVTRRFDDGEKEVASDLCETGYRLRRNPVYQDVMELWRRQSYHVDDKPLEDGVYERLHDRVVMFQVRYLASLDKNAEKLTSWDASKVHSLPALVDIELGLEAGPRTAGDTTRKNAVDRTLRYHRVIDMRPYSDMCMRLHPLPPTFKGGSGGDDASNDPDKGPKGDFDQDGITNDVDPDDDNDGTPDVEDSEPFGPGSGGGNGMNGGGFGDGGSGGDSDDPFGGMGGGGMGGGGGGGGGGGNPLEELLGGLGGG